MAFKKSKKKAGISLHFTPAMSRSTTTSIVSIVFLLMALSRGGAANQDQQNTVQPRFVIQSLRIPTKTAEPEGLEALLVQPSQLGPHPLAVITHGKPATGADRKAMTPQHMLPQAIEFARHGWTTAIVMRRGYGTSGGKYAESILSCSAPDYMSAARASSHDLRDAIVYLSKLPEIDSQHIIAIGPSGGGLAVTALTTDPPLGLVAAISFAGGLGHVAPDKVCTPGNLISTFWLLGKRSRIPMLWVYAKNDHFFDVELATNLYEEFTKAGGKATLIMAPPFGNEGHSLFTPSGIPIWAKYVEDFLKAQGLAVQSNQ